MPENTEPFTRREFQSMQDDLRKLREAVFGNGAPGMDEQIREIYKWIKRRERIENIILGTALSALVMLLINGFVYFFRVLPLLEKLSQTP